MATNDDKKPSEDPKDKQNNTNDEENEPETARTATSAQTARDMAQVTRYFNDAEGQGVDEEKLNKAIGLMNKASSRSTDAATSINIKLQKEDVELIINELEVPRAKAEKLLRENNGDVVSTLKGMIHA